MLANELNLPQYAFSNKMDFMSSRKAKETAHIIRVFVYSSTITYFTEVGPGVDTAVPCLIYNQMHR